MGEEYSENEIQAKVTAYWESLSNDEKLAAPDEYLEKYEDVMPRNSKEYAFRLKMSFWQVLADHPRMLKRLRDLG